MGIYNVNSLRFIGCCGAYCKTCQPYIEKFCKGCKLGYDNGERDIKKAKCRMKVCCFGERGLETCADCPDYAECETIHKFFSKNGFKYKKYRQAIEFLRREGYPRFLELASEWSGPYGKLR